MDWAKWHELYNVSPALQARLPLVREHLSQCFDTLSPGAIRVLSICAGDGRDLIGLLATHPRSADVTAYLVEKDAELVHHGERDIHEAGFEDRLTFVAADATVATTYQGIVPVDVVLMAGVFGNLRSGDVKRLIGSLRSLVRQDGRVVWTRHRRAHDGVAQIDLIRSCFTEMGFEEAHIENTSEGSFAVGTHCYRGAGHDLPLEERLFEFTGYDVIDGNPQPAHASSVAYYDTNGETFFQETATADLSALYRPFIERLPRGGHILDGGCGSGRDSLAFLAMGYQVTAFDASDEMVRRARTFTGLDVQKCSFHEFSGPCLYDGIWTCASLLHVPREQLPAIMARLAARLKPGGVWFLSFKHGSGERQEEGRLFTDLDESQLEQIVDALPEVSVLSAWTATGGRPGREVEWLHGLLMKSPINQGI